MATKIDQKIVKYEVVQEEKASEEASAKIIHMHERLERPEELLGSTYKVRTPLSEHSLYVTINDIVLNPGTEHELRRPFEVFINSKPLQNVPSKDKILN